MKHARTATATANVSASTRIPLKEFRAARRMTDQLIQPLTPEDMVVQSMPDASPAKWHIAHVSWFVEEFLLCPFVKDYQRYHPDYAFFFNSYYNAVGERWQRPIRGLQSRPSTEDIIDYRRHIDEQMEQLFTGCVEGKYKDDVREVITRRVWMGIYHEQQHQELLLMDILHLFSHNPLNPAYRPSAPAVVREVQPLAWIDYEGGKFDMGHDGNGFCYDHELPCHSCYIHPYRLANRSVTNGEWMEFMADGGYERHELWLSDGWDAIHREQWKMPLYWQSKDGDGDGDGDDYYAMTLHGLMPVNPAAPVAHVSYYEAMAFAHWAKSRLPTEAEWEHAAQQKHHRGAFLENECLYSQPLATSNNPAAMQSLLGGVWEWTMSAFLPYHGYSPPEGAIGEYNAKFMSGQMVMRGGSFATAEGHIRSSYRNFFYPSMRWQFGGLRLAQDGASS